MLGGLGSTRVERMRPEIKALLALPFVLALGIGVVYFIILHPIMIVIPLVAIFGITVVGFIWYNLYVLFGGKPW